MNKQPVVLSLIVCLSLIGCSSKPVATSKKASQTKEPIATIDGNVALAFSPDGKWLAVGAELIDTSNWKVAAKLEERVSDDNPDSKNHWGYTSAAFSPNSKLLALGDQDGTLRLIEVPAMKVSQEVLAHGARITGIGFAKDNETIVTTSVDDLIRLRIWNSRTGELLFRSVDTDKVPPDQQGPMANVVGSIDIFALSPNRELFAVADVMSNILVANVQDGKIQHTFKGPDGDSVEMDSLAFTPDSNKLLVAVTPEVHVVELNGQATSSQIATNADSAPIQVKLVNDNGLVAMYYGDKNSQMPVVSFYDLEQQKKLGGFFPHELRGNFWAVSPNGSYLATTGRGGPVQIWNIADALRDLTEM